MPSIYWSSCASTCTNSCVHLIRSVSTPADSSWLTTLLVWLVGVYVAMRYLFAEPLIWLQELHWHIFALIFLLGAAYTLKHDAHVRVDVFYAKFNPRRKAWVNLVGTLVFLIPFCLVVMSNSLDMVEAAWQIKKRSLLILAVCRLATSSKEPY